MKQLRFELIKLWTKTRKTDKTLEKLYIKNSFHGGVVLEGYIDNFQSGLIICCAFSNKVMPRDDSFI